MKQAVAALAALAQDSRLAVFRLLVEAGPAGLTPGRLGETLGLPAATLSFHLRNLTQAGLVEARQDGRFLIYTARFTAMHDLVAFLTDNCCGGHPEVCAGAAPAPAGAGQGQAARAARR